jgi:3-deoxy-D-manno-octulosonic-acid transferase
VPERPDALHLPTPPETLGDCDGFAKALTPQVVLWAGQKLRPALIDALRKTGSHMIALDAGDQPWHSPAPRWLPDPTPAPLPLFHSVYATGDAAARRLRRSGVETGRIRTEGPLIDADQPLPCDDAQYEEVAGHLAGRPVWLAAHLCPHEARDVLMAHRHAVRLAHRLLLVMVPDDDKHAAEIEAEARASQMRVCNWDAGETPDELTQVLLADGPDELGLWFRLAPLAFLGGSLVSDRGGHDPYQAASMGTAILYGPNVGRHVGADSRMVDAGAARIVRDADSLGAAVTHLIAPDQAAAMAHAGWDLISSGAALIDCVISEIMTTLDNRTLA